MFGSAAGRTRSIRPGAALTAALLVAAALAAAGSCDATAAAAAARAPRSLVMVGQFVTEFGTSGYMFACSAAAGAFAISALGREPGPGRAGLRRLAERSIFFFLAIAASGLAAQAIKHLLGRARPALPPGSAFTFHPLSLANSLASFPSGHTTSAFAAAAALALIVPRRRAWLFAAAALIGASRVLVGAHYPSDVVGGAALGGFAAVAVARLCARRGIAFTLREDRLVLKGRADRGGPPSR